MRLIIYCLVLLVIVPAVVSLAVFLFASKNSSSKKEDQKRPYTHYANDPNKVWEGISVRILNPSQSDKTSSNNSDPDRTIKSIQVLSSENVNQRGKIYRGFLSGHVDIKSEILYLCKITYESNRTEIEKLDYRFLKNHSDLVIPDND